MEALRSGEIEQAEKVLGTPDGARCCLGVLCDIAVQAGIIGPPQVEGAEFDEDERQCLVYDGATKTLPDSVFGWAGLREQYLDGTQMWSSPDDPKVTFTDEWVAKHGFHGLTDGTHVTTLSVLNDAGASFEAIADLIEEQL